MPQSQRNQCLVTWEGLGERSEKAVGKSIHFFPSPPPLPRSKHHHLSSSLEQQNYNLSYSSHFVPRNLYLSAKRVILTTFNIRLLLPCLKSSEDPILSQGIRSIVLILAHMVLPECPLLVSFTSPLSLEHLVPELFAHSSVGTLYLLFLPRAFTACSLIAYGFLLPVSTLPFPTTSTEVLPDTPNLK